MAQPKKVTKTASQAEGAKKKDGEKKTHWDLDVRGRTFERDAGSGMEGADKDSFAIPFLIVLQTNSPQCDSSSAKYIKGAAPGMFCNTATGQLFKGDKGISVIPAQFVRKFVEWGARDSGGGYKGDVAPENVDLASLERDDSGKLMLESGNYLVDTRYHFCILLDGEAPQPVILSFSSTQIKKSRQWMTMMANLRMEGSDGKKFTPPTFSHAYRIKTVSESNTKGAWKGVQIELDHTLGPSEGGLYELARHFRDQINAGKATADMPDADSPTAATAEKF
jgi:hypothetical protein